jgi:hypothetical protein
MCEQGGGNRIRKQPTVIALPASSLPAKQSVIPGISRTIVFLHVRSTIPTSSSFGTLALNWKKQGM